MKRLSFITFLFAIQFSFAQPNEYKVDSLFKITLTDTLLNSDFQKELIDFIKSEIKYPEIARKDYRAGIVKLKLTISNKFHYIEQIKIIHLSDPFLPRGIKSYITTK